jgi:hypothetical protein
MLLNLTKTSVCFTLLPLLDCWIVKINTTDSLQIYSGLGLHCSWIENFLHYELCVTTAANLLNHLCVYCALILVFPIHNDQRINTFFKCIYSFNKQNCIYILFLLISFNFTFPLSCNIVLKLKQKLSSRLKWLRIFFSSCYIFFLCRAETEECEKQAGMWRERGPTSFFRANNHRGSNKPIVTTASARVGCCQLPTAQSLGKTLPLHLTDYRLHPSSAHFHLKSHVASSSECGVGCWFLTPNSQETMLCNLS